MAQRRSRKNVFVTSSFATAENFSTAKYSSVMIGNLYRYKFKRRIKLPRLETYPLGYFSSIKSDFEEAIKKFPELSKQFELLKGLKETADEYKSFFQVTDICLLKIKDDYYAEIFFSGNSKTKEKNNQILDELGIC